MHGDIQFNARRIHHVSESIHSFQYVEFLLILSDGFPRTVADMEEWELNLGDVVEIRFLLEFASTEADMLERMFESGNNDMFFKNLESIAKKFQHYEDRVRPIQEYFANKHKRVNIRRDTSAVFTEACQLFRPLDRFH